MQLCQYGLQTAGQFDRCVLLRLGKVQYVVRDLLEPYIGPDPQRCEDSVGGASRFERMPIT